MSGPTARSPSVSATDPRVKSPLIIAETRPYETHQECYGDVCA